MRKHRGFTLIELLIAMSILLLMLGIAVSQYSTYDRRNNLILMADSVKAFIQSAQAEASSRLITEQTNYDSSKCNEIILQADTDTGGTVLNEYRLVNYDTCPPPSSTLSLNIINDRYKQMVINTTTNHILLAFTPPNKMISYLAPDGNLSNLTPVVLVLSNDSSESITLIINGKSITTTRNNF